MDLGLDDTGAERFVEAWNKQIMSQFIDHLFSVDYVFAWHVMHDLII